MIEELFEIGHHHNIARDVSAREHELLAIVL
jgi:hypothetical protein